MAEPRTRCSRPDLEVQTIRSPDSQVFLVGKVDEEEVHCQPPGSLNDGVDVSNQLGQEDQGEQ